MGKTIGFGLVAVVVALIVLAPGSSSTPAESGQHEEPAAFDSVEGSDLLRITLTASAAERLDIQTAVVGTGNGENLVVPSAALIITPDGRHWVYTNPQGLVFQRQEITDVVERDHQAYFVDGPSVGTAVVVTGVPELYGAEFGIGK